MKVSLATLASAAVLVFSAGPSPAQQVALSLPVPPPAYVCAAQAQNYGAISSYLNSSNMYKREVIAPQIQKAETYPDFEYALGQELTLDKQQVDFLKACKFFRTPSCQPGVETLASTTPADVALLVATFDADQGLTAIQGFFSIPPPPANFSPHEALKNFFTITEGSYCLLHPYSVHPSVVKGLKPPKF